MNDAGSIINFAPGEDRPWPDMAPLIRELSPPIPFPVDALGGTMAPAAKRIHQVVRAPIAICCQSILAAATLSAQHLADVWHGRRFPLSSFFISLGKSGSRKSGVDKWALWAHREYELDRVREYDAAMKEYKIAKKIYDADLRQAEREKGPDRQAAIEALKEPEAPLKPDLLVSEPTYEGLVRLFRLGHPSIGLFSDEGGRMLGGHGMNKENLLKTISSFSNLWSADPISVVRAGVDDSDKLYGRRFAMHLMIQPEIAAEYILGNDVMKQQGFNSRILFSYPAPEEDRWFVKDDLSQDPALQKYWDQQLILLHEKPRMRPGCRNSLDPKLIKFSSDASDLWQTVHDAIEAKRKNEYEPIDAFASKSAEHCQRLAGVLALNEDPYAEYINSETLMRAVELIEYYLAEALRLNDMGQASKGCKLELAEKLVQWFKTKNRRVFTLREIYQLGPSKIRDRQTAADQVHILFEHGYCRPRLGEQDRIDTMVYEVNPGVFV